MNIMPRRLKHVMRAANVATVATTVLTSALGKGKNEAASTDAQQMAAGAAVHAGAMYAWSFVLEGVFGKWVRRAEDVSGKLGRAAVAGATVSALAYVTNRYVAPKRLTPAFEKFEKRLSPLALATTYGVLAASLAAGTVWASRATDA